MATARYFDKSKQDGYLPGVPLRDLDEAEFEAFPQWLKDSVDASPMYRKTPLPKAAKPALERPTETKE